MIQTTSLHDILWHFVASLTPSPFEPEDEEDEENKGNKEIVEQVMINVKKQTLLLWFCLLHLLILNVSARAPRRKETSAFVNTLCRTSLLPERRLIRSPTPSTASFRPSLTS